MQISAGDIRVGNVLIHNNKMWKVSKTMITKPGKGGAFMQAEMKEIQSGTKLNERFRTNEKVERATIDTRDFQFLYNTEEEVTLMDKENFEQITLGADDLSEEESMFLQEGMDVIVSFHEEKPISISLPETWTYTVSECEPVVKGQTVASSYKPATLDNGARIMVPPFINTGDKVVVKIEEQSYVERA